jgi:hypothetical protein
MNIGAKIKQHFGISLLKSASQPLVLFDFGIGIINACANGLKPTE